MAYLTGNGETYIIDVMRGQADGSGTLTNPLGFNRVGVWGSTAGAADALIGSFQTPTWAVPSGTSYMYNQSDISFTIPADTVVKGIALYCTTIYATTSIAFGDELVSYTLATPQSTTYGATLVLPSGTGIKWQLERGDL